MTRTTSISSVFLKTRRLSFPIIATSLVEADQFSLLIFLDFVKVILTTGLRKEKKSNE